jgi:hypothetical protein
MSAVAQASDALPAHKFTRANDSKALAALLRNFFATGFEPAPIRLAEGRGWAPGLAVSLRAWTRPKNGRALISRCETKRFAWHNVSHWNHYGRRISDFAGLFVFNDLTPFSFRRFRSLRCSDLLSLTIRRLARGFDHAPLCH